MKEYWFGNYCMSVKGYKCILRHYTVILETITDTEVSAVNYFNSKYNLGLKKVR